MSATQITSSSVSAVNEISSGGAVQSFTIDADAGLSTPIDTVDSGGGNPAFAVALSTGEVAVVNYGSGTGRIMPTTSRESRFNSDAPLITFPAQDGTSSHPHMVLEHNNEVLIPDLVRRLSADFPYVFLI
jgi:6-phosphogluconolactonase (cycloisomerase 2 family)